MTRNSIRDKANEIMALLNEIPFVKKCTLYGSIAENTFDELSDIDIEIDVSGYDNGEFMLKIIELVKGKLDIYYADYAPSLVPEKYIVSLAIDKNNPFLILDLCCAANPHCTTVTKEQVMGKNDNYAHLIKLFTANLKHFIRGNECYKDILKMAKKASVKDAETKKEAQLLSETLQYLEGNIKDGFDDLVKSLRINFEKLIAKK